MRHSLRLAALAAASLLSTAGLGVQAADAAPIAGVRVCTSDEHWTFTQALTLTPAVLGPGAIDADYTATCPHYIVDSAPPFLVTGVQGPYTASTAYGYLGNCVLAVLTRDLTHNGILVGGAVAVTYSVSVGTFQNVSVKVLVPEPDVCSENEATGLGVTVGTL